MTIYRGGADLERLYLEDLTFTMNGEEVVVKKTDIPGVNMADLIARHKGRYALCGLFLRPGMEFLDFPCGSGYAAQFLAPFSINYLGMDGDSTTITYAQKTYFAEFAYGDLREPKVLEDHYHVIACIEGLEHIEQKYQAPLIEAFYKALKPGGTLIVSCPMASPFDGSGPNPDNPYHLWELTWTDFEDLLSKFFPTEVDMIGHIETLSTGKKQTMMFGICHKE